ncbi:MAG: MBOAT family protein [Clostridiales Family XIII bacterium]|jgi:D-alanyl-lipoteichoic acid acyltransferase DltB (MBOAT superfamily)|nr:MBOAT family protein [Clostridiales Family XIII bacterium]
MVFSSAIFIFCFLPLCLLGYYLVPKRFRNYFFLFMSILFYAYGEPKFVFVMLLSVLANWVFGLLANRYRTQKTAIRWVLAAMAVFNVGILFAYKYLNFVIENVNTVFHMQLPKTELLLPIGLSFVTFQAMSYVIDIYRGSAQSQKSLPNTALYILMFPPLIAGPIVRYETVADQITNRTTRADDFSRGVRRFIFGFAKKAIVANSVAITADEIFSNSNFWSLTVLTAWIGILCYTLQIYFDFSGYSDMAIGLGLMFGFHFRENFNYPYISKTVTEFWRRWHISLSSWFRDYVYFPLGGSRVRTKGRLVFNLFVVWMLTGIWHGASWNFVLWGFFYFVLLTFEKLFGIPGKVAGNPVLAILYRLFTILCFTVGWVIFRAPDIGSALKYTQILFLGRYGFNKVMLLDGDALYYLAQNWVILLIAIIGCTPAVKWAYHRVKAGLRENNGGLLAVQISENVICLVLFVIALAFMASGQYNPFIYFNF